MEPPTHPLSQDLNSLGSEKTRPTFYLPVSIHQPDIGEQADQIQHSMQAPIRNAKRMAVAFMLCLFALGALSLSAAQLTLIAKECINNQHSNNSNMHPISYDTLNCSHLLTVNDIYVSTCNKSTQIRVNIRQLHTDFPTERGIYLTEDSWKMLKQFWYRIDEAVALQS